MLELVKRIIFKKNQKKRLIQMKRNPFKRIDSENMSEIEKMDKGFNGKTYSINGIDIDF